MKKEYQNPATSVVVATLTTVLMGSDDKYHDLESGGNLGGGPGAAPGRIVYV